MLGLVMVILASSLGAGAIWLRARSRRLELAEARREMEQGLLGLAQQRLSRLLERWDQDGEVLVLLGECEMERNRKAGDSEPQRRARAAAMAAWARVPRSSSSYPRAALLRATQWTNTGRYAPAEEALVGALVVGRLDANDRYELERALSRLYRFEGRVDDVRRVLRASWCRSPDPAGVLKELWLLDHSPVPVEAMQRFLEHADDQDDRVWLGRANHTIITGRYDDAARWLDAALRQRPEDEAVWRAKLALARSTDDLAGFRAAAAHLAAADFEPGAVHEFRAWLAGRLGRPDLERRELMDLIRVAPGEAWAVERLAVLAFEAGQVRESEEFRRRKAAVDRAQDRVRRILLDADLAPHAAELAQLCRSLGREFDSQGWSLVNDSRALAPARPPDAKPTSGPPIPDPLLDRAIALSAPHEAGTARVSRAESPSLSDRLADLRAGEATPRDVAAIVRDPSAVRPSIRFADDAEAVDLRFTFDNGQTARRLLPETMSGGVALLDFDGDGWLDVYCVQGGSLLAGSGLEPAAPHAPGDRLFRNRGDGTFEDATESSRIAGIAWGRGYGLGVAVADYDNDGDPDLFVTRLATYALYRNRGDGTFEDATAPAGLAGRRDNPTSAAFADLDNDGDLDLYVCHYMLWDPRNPPTCLNDVGEFFYCDPSKVEPAPDHLFRNDGGRFVDVTAAASLADTQGRGLGVVAADFDDDHRVDLYVANDGTANYFYRNKGGLRFEEVALEAGVAGSASGGYQAGMGVACGDLDGDGRLDLLVTNFYGEGTTFYQNLGQGLFADRSAASGIGLASRYLLGFGIGLADVGNAGRPDVLITNGHVNDRRPYFPYAMPSRLYRNQPDGRLADISREAGDPWQVARVGRGLAVGDLDNDGRPDAVILAQNEPLAYFHNRSERVGRFVVFRLEGTTSNRDGVGARVTIQSGGRRQFAHRIGGGSYQSANDPRLHFGLGASDRIESVEVRWPSGKLDRHEDMAPGRGYLLREGDPKPRPLRGYWAPPE
jgi:tetratricopeptide (TPR) repeat protein